MLDRFNGNVSLTWKLSRDLGAFKAAKQGPESMAFSLDPLDTDEWDQALLLKPSIAPSSTLRVGLDTFSGLLEPGAMGSALAVYCQVPWVSGSGPRSLTLRPSESGGASWFMPDSPSGINIPVGGCNFFSDYPSGSGTQITSANGGLDLYNPNSETLTPNLLILGAS